MGQGRGGQESSAGVNLTHIQKHMPIKSAPTNANSHTCIKQTETAVTGVQSNRT